MNPQQTDKIAEIIKKRIEKWNGYRGEDPTDEDEIDFRIDELKGVAKDLADIYEAETKDLLYRYKFNRTQFEKIVGGKK